MPYASSIQTLNDANGQAYAFLEDGGLLWQCQWNTQAERWDKAQVVPGAYGGEKLQALLVDNLWPTSGTTGNQAGNTPGIVLAYRIGTEAAAKIYTTLGQWDSQGQLSWSEPLLVAGSGSVIEEIGLRSSGDGTFELISQRREPAAADPGNTLQTITGACSDSELIRQSFQLRGSEGAYEFYNITTNSQDPSLTGITFTSDPAPVAPASATSGSTQFSRADLLFPFQQAAAPLRLGDSKADPGTSGALLGLSLKDRWSGGIGIKIGNPTGQFTAAIGIGLGQTRSRWELKIPNSSAPIDWYNPQNNQENAPSLRALEIAKKDLSAITSIAKVSGNTSNKKTIGLIGGFGTYGYGTQITRNDIGLTFILEQKMEGGAKLDDAIKKAKEALLGAALAQRRRFGTLTLNYQTKYYYSTLDPLSSAFSLKKIKSTWSLTGGFERQVREILETGGYVQTSYGISLGLASQNVLMANPDKEMPSALKWLGYSAGVAGALFGVGSQFINYKRGFANVDALNDKSSGDTNSYNKFNEKVLGNPNTNKNPYKYYQQFQFIQALLGTAYAVVPPFWNLGDQNISNGTNQFGFTQRATGGFRYLYKSIAGFYGTLAESAYYYPKQSDAYSGSPWQIKLQVNVGAALPFGVSIPIFGTQFTFPNPDPKALKASTAQVNPSAASSAGNSSNSNYAYLPASGSTLLPNSGNSDGAISLVDNASSLQLFTLSNDTGGAGSSTSSPLQLDLTNRGSGLIPGTYEGVPILAESLPGSAGASLSFNVLADGTLDPTSIQIKVPAASAAGVLNGQYLFLPETSPNSGIYALIPDVFSTGSWSQKDADGNLLPILLPPDNGNKLQAIRDLRTQLPVITARTYIPGPLTRSDIVVIPKVVPVNNSTASGMTSVSNPIPSDNSLRTYTAVPVSLNTASLNTTKASVSLSNGTIVKIVLDDPLYVSSKAIPIDPSTNKPVADFALTVALLSNTDFLADYNPPAESSNPVYTLAYQSQGYSNVVEDQSYSANPGYPANSDQATGSSQQVWLADGINDQWQQTPSQAGWPVFNRVVFGSFDGATKQWTLVYLNGSQIDSAGRKAPMASLEPDKVTLKNLYNTLGSEGDGPVYTFTAASTPTVITVAAGTAGLASSTGVFWVEAVDPVIPESALPGSPNYYQAYLSALYGRQRINFRIKKPNGTWENPVEMYTPEEAIIRHLKAFDVEMDGRVRTMLVWDETSIAAIKDTPPDPIAIKGWIDADTLTLSGASEGLRIGTLITGDGVKQGTLITGIITPFDKSTNSAIYRLSTSQSIGTSTQPAALNATPLLPPTLIKAGFLNPDAKTIQWSDLFSDGGKSTITTIPWDQTNDIGVGIESLSVASKQVMDAGGEVRDAAVLSWSLDVRQPYVESVLNDQPLIFLQFADLKPGFNDINIGSTASETTTGTSASSTGLNFTVASALSKSSGSAVQNSDGTGVIATGTGSQNSLYNSIFNSTPINQRTSSPLSQLTGTITGTTLTVIALSGELAVGDLLTGPGLAVDTQVTAVLSAFDAAKGTGQYSISTAPLGNLTSSTEFEAVPDPKPSSSKDLGLPYSSLSGSINGTTLAVSQLNGSLAVGDAIIGEGVRFGTTISALINVNPATGLGDYQLSADPLQQGIVLAPSALIATPSSSVPYTIEFWTKLPSNSNPQGAGLVAFGQPSQEAVGKVDAPTGWLMTSTFTVQRITMQQAAAQGFQDAYDKLNSNSAKANDLYAWGWSLDATGANTTALGGSGGSNVYSNALSLTNLYSGQTISGVDTFLESYGLQPGDLAGGDGQSANTIDLVPGTSLDFNISLDPDTGQPVSNLNAINIDTASSLLNSGLVVAKDGQLSSDPTKDQNLKAMFQALWDYQESYDSAKVAFTLAPATTRSITTSGFEQYGGLELAFTVSAGPAVSVNPAGNLVFDVAEGVALSSAATAPSDKRQSPLPADLRDDQWHYVVATYLPTYRSYTINGIDTLVPTNSGTASLYVDNQLVASQENVSNAYLATNINDTALLLASNAGGSIDQFALYNKALLPAPPLTANPTGLWPEPNQNDALSILKQLGYPATADTPNPGAVQSAISQHWRSRDINPDNALLATFSSSFTPSSPAALSGNWSEAAPLNPIPQAQATIPSAKAASLAEEMVIQIDPGYWSGNNWSTTSTSSKQFNPGGETLNTIVVTLTPDQGGDPVTRQLSAEQILMGSSTTLATLQPAATSSDLDYQFLSSSPALGLLITRKSNRIGDRGTIEPGRTYTSTVEISVKSPNSATDKNQTYTTIIPGLNTNDSQVFTAYSDTASINAATSQLNKRSTALATAAVIEAAPLQLKYIDSGVVLNSATSQQAANSPSIPSPAPTFGQSMAYGWFQSGTASVGPSTTTTPGSGWLAVAQPSSTNAISDPAGRLWIQYTGDFTITAPNSDPETGPHTAVSDPAKAPNTWLNALANSNFSPEAPNLPLLNDKTYPKSYGGLLIKADPTLGWGQSFGQTMLVADINNDGVQDLVISAPSANGGGKVLIIDGNWIKDNLTNSAGERSLNLASPDDAGSHVLVLSPGTATSTSEDASQSAFGWSLAFDSTSSKLFIGAPNYSRKVGPDEESVPIGAVYQYTSTSQAFRSGYQSLENPTVGIAGRTFTHDVSGPATNYWGAQLGASLAVSDKQELAIGAPGVEASLLYSGTEAVNQLEAGDRNPSAPYGQGALVKVMLPTKAQPNLDGVDVDVTSDGTDYYALADVINKNTTDKNSNLANEENTYMQALNGLQTKPIAKASADNNSAIQTAAVGSVYLIDVANSKQLTAGTLRPSNALATFFGPNPWNIGGATDFGASLAFGDISNKNTNAILAVGAPSTGGPGAVYLINTSEPFAAPNGSDGSTSTLWIKDTNLGANGVGQKPNQDGDNQYLAYLTSGLTLYGAEDLDQFGTGVVNLGDTNGDGYDDLLVQAPNASAGAGNGYVVFGNDNLMAQLKANASKNSSGKQLLGGHNPAVGNVKPGSSGQLTFADGTPLTLPILSELGHGIAAATGQGSFGAGDVDANGNNDIQLGSGINGQAYLTYGKDYLAAINNLQLQKLASNNGFLLEGLATTTQGSLRSIGDFNGDGYGDFLSIQPGNLLDMVRLELGANTQDILANYAYNFYTFSVAPGTQVLPAGDINGDGYSDIALFLQQNLSSVADGNAGAGSTTGILYGRNSSDLPIGSGFGWPMPVEPTTSAPLTTLPGANMAGGLTDAAPSVIAVGNTLYAAVKGVGNGDTSIWFTQSNDGGNTWKTWTNLSSSNPAFATNTSPSLTFFNNKLYLAYLNTADQLELSSWDPNAGNPALWNTPTLLSDGSNVFTSNLSPQLIGSGNALAISWLDPVSNTLASSITTAPESTIWTPADGGQGGGSSTANPALAIVGNTVYMARVGLNNQLYWTSSTDGGQSWADWQELPSGMTSNDAPSLAVVNGKIYLTYLGSGNQLLNITQLLDAGSNHWSAQTVLSDQHAKKGLGAVAIGERVNGTEGLAIYYVADNDSGLLLRTWSATPQTASSWSPSQQLNGQTASSPLAVTGFNGSTYLAYQGGTPGAPSTTAKVTNASDPGSSSLWSVIASLDAGNHDGVGLSSNSTGLLLNTTDSGTGQQAIYALTPASGGGSWSQSYFNKRASASATASTASLLSLSDVNGKAELLMAVTDPSRDNSTVTSTRDLVNNWIPQQQLLERKENNGVVSLVPISASAAPTATLLNGTPVLAVNNNGTINIYAGNAGGKSFSLTSSFTPGSGGLAGTTSPGITTTETGLALSYANADGSINLQRLNFLQLDGTPVEGVAFNADGSIDTSKANLQWQGINLAANSGLSSGLATVPLSVDGNLLLANVRNSPSENTQIWLNAVPNLSEPDSTTWLNTTVQLPDGRGGWLAQQQADPSTSSTLTAAGDITGDGLEDMLITTNNVVLAGSPLLKTGVRLIRGASTSAAFLDANKADASTQTLQLAAALPTNSSAASTGLTGGASVGRLPQLTISGQSSSLITRITSQSDQTLASFTATASSPNSLTRFFETAAQSQQALGPASGQGQLALNTSGSYGDLNGDGRLDFLAADSPTTLYGVNQQSWAVWSVRAAGDVNGNGVDDVLLALRPLGPAYDDDSVKPHALETVLLDGSLFRVDKSNHTFRLDQLRSSLNPYNASEINTTATTSNDEIPLLQSWLQPILSYEAGEVSSMTVATNQQVNPAGALSQSAPSAVLDGHGKVQMFFSGWVPNANNSYGIWTAVQDEMGGWQQFQLSTSPDSPIKSDNTSPSAAYYKGQLYVAYCDQSNQIWISHPADPQADPRDPGTIWTSYQIKSIDGTSTTLETTYYKTPTLLAEEGRLALYFPSNNNVGKKYEVRYLYSSNPDSESPQWGSRLNDAESAYIGVSGILKDLDGNSFLSQSPVSAVTFQGRTVLAFMSDVNNRVLATAPTAQETEENPLLASSPGSKKFYSYSYSTKNSPLYNISLATDQALLYAYGVNPYTADSLYSFKPTTSVGQYSGVGPFYSNSYGYGSSSIEQSLIPLYMLDGVLMASGVDASNKIEIAPVDVQATEPSQQSLAGYSIDGNIDINGDGFMDMLVSDPSDSSKSVNNQYALFGGDYLNIASQVGTPGDDVMIGTPLADVIYTLQGADQVNSNGGKDVIYTGAGDDSISIKDYAFIRIDAGAGFNSLQLEGNADQRWNFAVTGSDAPLWAPVANGGSSNQSPAMVSDGNTIYMARRGLDSYLYWTQSADGGLSWADWQQLPAVITSNNTPSLAIAGGDLYLAYVGLNQSVYVTQFYGDNQWDDEPVILYQDIQYSPPTATKVKNGFGQLAAIAETVSGAEGLAIYYVDAASGDIFRQYNNADGLGFVDLYTPYYWETSDLFPALGPLAVTEFNGSTYMAQVDDRFLYTDIYSPGGNDPAISSNWNYIATKTIGNSSGISLSSIPKAGGETSSGLLLNTTDIAGNQQVTYLLADAIPNSSFQPFNSRSSASASSNQQTASILAIPAKANSQSVLLEAVADASRAATVSVSISDSINPEPGIFSGTQLKNIQLISSIDYGANTLVFDAAGVNAINSDRVVFLTPDASDTIILSQEFEANPSFNITYAGSLLTAYAAGVQNTPADSSPTLIYVLNPSGASASDWLSTNVTINTAAASSTSLRAAFAAPLGVTDSSSESSIPTTSAVHQTVPFGSGLTLTSYRTNHSDAEARFSVSSSDTSKPRALLYAISSAYSSAEPGRHYTAIAGVAVLAKGQSSFDITVPINGEAFSQLRNGTLSLRVEEISYSDQMESIHLLIEPTPAADGGLPPVLSALSLSPDSSGSTATLEFRADTNDGRADTLNLSIARRNSADTVAVSQRQLVSINDFKQVPGDLTPAYNLQNLDHDVLPNQQVQTSLLLNLKPTGNDPLVSLLGPELNWQSTVQLLNGNQVRFQQDAPLTSWRADSGAGLVTFGLQSGSNNLTLISNAQGGSAGSLNSNNANGATSWQSTEGKAIGSRSITDGQNLKGSDWTPTASRGGVSLALLNLAVDGNQVTASFEGGVTGVFWQADGNAPSLLPVPASVEVQRLAGYNNSLGFYSVDSITGMVAGLKPGDTGYLQAALARSQEEDLLLDARTLPAFGATATFNSLPLDTRERYGVLLLQNGDETKIFSSFAAANEGGATQMVSLSNSSNSLVLGIEDMSVAKGLGDNDFNDIIVKIQGVSLGLF
jgi:hypothetical protein